MRITTLLLGGFLAITLNAADNEWVNFGGAVSGTGTVMCLTNAVSSVPRFYRVISP